MKRSILIGLCTISLLSCKTRRVTSTSQHTLGNTSRTSEGLTFYPCKSDSNDNFPNTLNYIKAMAEHIMKSNLDVFSKFNQLGPDQFCYEIIESDIDNATGGPADRKIKFSTALLWELILEGKDGEIAATLAHELAHISMRHVQHDRVHPAYTPTESFKSIQNSYYSLLSQIKAQRKALEPLEKKLEKYGESNKQIHNSAKQIINEAYEAYGPKGGVFDDSSSKVENNAEEDSYETRFVALFPSELKSIAKEYFEGTIKYFTGLHQQKEKTETLQTAMKQETAKDKKIGEDAYSWVEREADEVGLEFYVKAGFDRENAFSYHAKKAYQDLSDSENGSIDPMQCLILGAATFGAENLRKLMNEKIPQGTSTHPARCWRVLHMIYETRLHGEHYEQISAHAIKKDFSELRNLSIPELSAVSQSSMKALPLPLPLPSKDSRSIPSDYDYSDYDKSDDNGAAPPTYENSNPSNYD